LNRKYLLPVPALVIVILAANWNAKSDADHGPVGDLGKQLEKNKGSDRRRFLLRLVLLCGSTARPVVAGEKTKKNGEKGKKVTVQGEVLDMLSKRDEVLAATSTEIVHGSSSILRRIK
jgi:hypothetical protein